MHIPYGDDVIVFTPYSYNNLFSVRFLLSALGRYTDVSGAALVGPSGQTNVAIAEYIGSGDLLGLEELHVFFELAWFDMGSWAWGHYLAEWGTRGIFQVKRLQAQRKASTNRPVNIPRRNTVLSPASRAIYTMVD